MILSVGGPSSEPWLSWSYLNAHSAQLRADLSQHVQLTLSAVLIGLVISLPLAVLAVRVRRTSGPILGLVGVLYTIPSLAAIVALYPIFGLTTPTVVIPLSAYTLVILVRNIITGLLGVPPEAREAAVGMGFGSLRLLLRVELPLALPAIIAGIRVATVSTIALVTIGGYIGEGGLGNEIIGGLNSLYKTQVGTGSLLVVLLAVTADALLLGVQWLLTPWQRGAKA